MGILKHLSCPLKVCSILSSIAASNFVYWRGTVCANLVEGMQMDKHQLVFLRCTAWQAELCQVRYARNPFIIMFDTKKMLSASIQLTSYNIICVLGSFMLYQ